MLTILGLFVTTILRSSMVLQSTVIPPAYFLSQTILEREQEMTWQLFWSTMDVRDHNDFTTGTIGEISVVVQNIRGKLYGLHNVCSHTNASVW